MKLLLDTHVLLWAHGAPSRLSRVQDLVMDGANDLVVSAATAWEIAIKVGLGKLVLTEAAHTWVPSRIAAMGAASLPISQVHALAVADLPPHHRDPFDRILIAQARTIGASLVTADAAFEAYDVDVVRV